MLRTICKFLLSTIVAKIVSNLSYINSQFNDYRANVERVSKFLYVKLES